MPSSRSLTSRWFAGLCAALLFGAACSGGSSPKEAAPSGDATTVTGGRAGAADEKKGGDENGGRAGKEGAEESEQRPKNGPVPRQRNEQRGDSEGGASQTVPHPAAGRYTYDQSGWEEFCQASCDRDPLPDTQTVDIRLEDREAEAATVVTEAHPTEDRVARSTIRYTNGTASITKVFTSFEYSGFTFSEEYEPKPPVESLHLPLRVGRSWSGKWEAKTSGTYSVAVSDREEVTIDDRSIDAFRVDTRTRFRGQFEGRAAITVWIDPETLAVLRSEGELDVSSNFGKYRTKFETLLDSAPSY